MYNVDPMALIQAIKNGQNPQQLLMGILQNNSSTPMGANLLKLVKEGNITQIEQIARNIAQQRGVDYDKEFQNFVKNLGINRR